MYCPNSVIAEDDLISSQQAPAMGQCTQEANAKYQVDYGEKPQSAITPELLRHRGLVAVLTVGVFVEGGEEGQGQSLFFGEGGQRETHRHGELSEAVAGRLGAVQAQEQPEGQQIEEGQLQVGNGGDPVHRLRVNGVQGEEDRGHKRQGGVPEHPLRHGEEENDYEAMKEQVDQVKRISPGSEHAKTEQVTEVH